MKAAGEKIDPIGYAFVPFGYAAGQVLAQAVEATKSLDHARLADFIHQHTFSTVVGEINYARTAPGRPRARWSRNSRMSPQAISINSATVVCNRCCGRRNTRPAP